MSDTTSHGVISHETERKTDYLYRVSIKCLVHDGLGNILVVKEAGRDFWDLPGGGMDHEEDLKASIAREMREEVNLKGDFSYRVIHVDDPLYLAQHNFWQLRLIFELWPRDASFSAGEDADEIAFMNPELFKDSSSNPERRIYEYAQIASLT